MNIPINYQREKIKKYFNLLVEEFITDPRHKKDINIIFKQKFKNVLKLVPGSKRTTATTTYFPYKYVITFLNNYKNEDELRGTVVHEFTHLYLYATIGKHDHDDRFYSQMEILESWLDKNQGLSPRLDKIHDRDQYVGDNNSDTKDKENTCPECSYSSPHHSPQCSHKQSKNNSVPQKTAEFSLLKKTLKDSKNLATLEKNYQTVKASSLYSNSKGDKSRLDNLYQAQK
ncbi:9070_t:CDS:2 [Ambispora gerdemannii]|uniref:9070_t:CDS:1 n=1 Tax=Ambispora gerdemannii TaxID=144530 RepID=A0A9N8VH46_9GLOM|nr:9070_t:CDS:2 [Ambispora gerdemannii]